MGVFKRTTKRNGKKREYWYIDYVINGKHKWESVGRVGVVSKSDAKRLFELRQSEILQGKLRGSKNMVIPSFSDFAKEYLEYAKGNKKSWDRDECALKSLVPFFGTHKLNEITPLHIEKYKLLRKKTVSQRTINIELSLLRRMFNLAISWEKCSSSPMRQVSFYKEVPSKERILSKEEEINLVQCSPEHIKPILITALNTGMRYGEIINLSWNDIDFESGYIHILRSKTGTDRKIPINDLLNTTLNKLKTQNPIGKSIGTYSIPKENSQQYQLYNHVDPLVSKAVGLTSVGVQVPPPPILSYYWSLLIPRLSNRDHG
ncbi:MAG: tyrosine-type recombinase/integrase [Thermodesulfobacteriota bacterium]